MEQKHFISQEQYYWLRQQQENAKPSLRESLEKFMIDHDLSLVQMTDLLGDYIEQISPNRNSKC